MNLTLIINKRIAELVCREMDKVKRELSKEEVEKLFSRSQLLGFLNLLANFLVPLIIIALSYSMWDFAFALLSFLLIFIINIVLKSVCFRNFQKVHTARDVKACYLNIIVNSLAPALFLIVLLLFINLGFRDFPLYFSNRSQYWPDMLMSLFYSAAFTVAIFFCVPLYFRYIHYFPSKAIRRQDLDEKFSEDIKKLGIKARFYYVKGPAGLPGAGTFLASNDIIIQEPIENILNEKEFRAIVLHELSHQATMGVATVYFLLAFLGLFSLSVSVMLGFYNSLPAMAVLVLSGVIGVFLLLAQMRDYEREANEMAKGIAGKEIYKSAIDKLYEYSKAPKKFKYGKIMQCPQYEETVK